jgi:hypothetical protein
MVATNVLIEMTKNDGRKKPKTCFPGFGDESHS